MKRVIGEGLQALGFFMIVGFGLGVGIPTGWMFFDIMRMLARMTF